MLIILPLFAFALGWALFYHTSPGNRSWRASFMRASILWGAYVAVNTELLSLFSALSTTALSLAWLILIGALTLLLYKRTPVFRTAFVLPRYPLGLSKTDSALIFCVAGIVIAVGMIALIAPPNTWDSMSYHMSRVAHWVQNKTVRFFPVSITRELWASPWAEYAIAQLQILSHSDRFSNMVQWWSMTGSIIGVSLIAQLLGATRRGQILSAVLCACLPVGILEGSSTQNDYAAAFWTVCCVYYAIQSLTEIRYSTARLALAFALAVLTKTTTMVFLAPFILWITAAGLRKHGKTFLPVLFFLAAAAFALNFAQCARNYQLNGNIFSLTSESQSVQNKTYTVQGAISNAARYVGLNLAVNNDPLNKTIESVIVGAHHLLNWNVADPRYTAADEYRVVYSRHEDSAGNTAATLMLVAATILFLFCYRRSCSAHVLPYLLSWTAGFLLFCLALKWQPWGNRLLLPLAVLSTPFIAIVLEKVHHRAGTIIACTLIIFSLPWVLDNTSRPILSKDNSIVTKDRNEQYFANTPGMYFSYRRAAEEIANSGCKDVGLVMGPNSWEYPLWALWAASKNENIRVEHVNVKNSSEQFDYPLGAFDPCAVIGDDTKETSRMTVNNQTYVKINQWAFLGIFRKDPDGKVAAAVRNSYFIQMIQASVQSDQILIQAQASGNLNQDTVAKAFQLRQMAVEQAKLLNVQELNGLYQGFGSAVKDLFIKGNELFLDGLTSQNPAKIDQGQSLLGQWNIWLQKNMKKLQKVLE